MKVSFQFCSVLACSVWLGACGDQGGAGFTNQQPSAGSGGAVASGSSGSGAGGTTAGASGAAGAGALACMTGSGGSAGNAGSAGSAGNAGSGGANTTPSTEKFSFFVASLKAMQQLSGSEDGFGGDLRFGETGDGAGLKGADKICTTIAEQSMPGNNKTWRAFLSATKGEDGAQVDAINRVGEGPWYDRTGRLIAQNKTDLVAVRPMGADPAIIDDLPNEDGVPNHEPNPGAGEVDNHDVLTGTSDEGTLFSTDAGSTCNDWTSAEGETGEPRCGHSWPRSFGNGGPGGPGGGGSGETWMSALDEAGCAPGAWIIEAGPPGANGTKSVGDGGGYGGIYCFALNP